MSISVVGIVGAGFMGSGIAESSAVAGKHVLLFEPDEAPLERSRASLRSSVEKAVSRGKIAENEAEIKKYNAAVDKLSAAGCGD